WEITFNNDPIAQAFRQGNVHPVLLSLSIKFRAEHLPKSSRRSQYMIAVEIDSPDLIPVAPDSFFREKIGFAWKLTSIRLRDPSKDNILNYNRLLREPEWQKDALQQFDSVSFSLV